MAETMKRLSDAELEIMRVIWEAGEALTSNAIQDRLTGRSWALSTLMTALARLVQKGFVHCDRSTRTNYYAALVGENEYMAMEGKTLLEKLCGSSLRNLVTSLYEENAIDERDLSELRSFLSEFKAGE